ncbi:MAG: ABC transporter ATP-binding protein [Acetivibrio sp.]
MENMNLRDIMKRFWVESYKKIYLYLWFGGIFLLSIINLTVSYGYGKIAESSINKDVRTLINIALGLTILMLVKILLNMGTTGLLGYFREKTTIMFKEKSFHNLLKADYYWLEKQNISDLIVKQQQCVASAVDFLCDYIPDFIKNITASLLSIIFLIGLNWKIAIIYMLIFPFVIYIQNKVSELVQQHGYQVYLSDNKRISLSKSGIEHRTSVKVYKATDFILDKYKETNKEWIHGRKVLIFAQMKLIIVSLIISILPLCIVAGLAAFFVIEGNLSLPIFITFVTIITDLTTTLIMLSQQLFAFRNAAGSAVAIFESWDVKTEEGSCHIMSDETNMVSFNQVSFCYENKEILKDVSFEVKKGEKVAIIGASGAGKTTIIKLLLGLYKPASGKISIGVNNLNENTSYRDQIAYLDQNATLFIETVKNNILYGNQMASQEEFDSAIFKSNINFLSESEIVNTVVEENGGNFSGGQNQRIAWARTYLRGAPLFLLDEPTSALDIKNEESIIKSLSGTVILITHRLSVAEKMDRILILENGKIVKQGTPKQLLNDKNYFSLWLDNTVCSE